MVTPTHSTGTTPITPTTLPVPPERSEDFAAPITTPAILLLGDTGSGKTFCNHTWLDFDTDLELFALITEPNGLDSLLDSLKGDTLKRFHYHVVAPGAPDIDMLLKQAATVTAKDVGSIQQMNVGLDKQKFVALTKVLHQLKDFQDQRTGKSFGPVQSWTDNKVLLLDSLTGLCQMVTQHITGTRPTMTMPEFGVAQTMVRNLLTMLTSLDCWFVLTAHLDAAIDELSGTRKHFPLAIGRALPPEIPRFFSEVILTKRNDNRFNWSTSDDRAVVKNRALPVSDNLVPSFVRILEAHRKRKQRKPA